MVARFLGSSSSIRPMICRESLGRSRSSLMGPFMLADGLAAGLEFIGGSTCGLDSSEVDACLEPGVEGLKRAS